MALCILSLQSLGSAQAQLIPDCTKDFYILDGNCLGYPSPDVEGKTYLQRSHCPLSFFSVGNDCLQAPQACNRRHGSHVEYSLDGVCWCEESYAFENNSCEYVNLAHSGREEKLSRIENKRKNFESSSSSPEVIELPPVMDFPDVPTGHPYYEAVQWGRSQGIINGYEDGSFQPERLVNRAEFLLMLLKAAGVTDLQSPATYPFSDVDPSFWYAPAVSYALQNGIVQGYSDDTFRPEQLVSLAEMLKMSYLTLGVQTIETEGEWYQRYLSHAQQNNILFSHSIKPDWAMTRQDVIWILWRLRGN